MKRWLKRTGIALGLGAAIAGGAMLSKSPKKPAITNTKAAIERKVATNNAAKMREAQTNGQKIKLLTNEEHIKLEEKRKANITAFVKSREPVVSKVISTNSMILLWDGFSKAFTNQGMKFGEIEFDRSMIALKDKLKNSPGVRKTWVENYPVGETGHTRYGKKLTDLVSRTSTQNFETYSRVQRVETIVEESSKLPIKEKQALLKVFGL